MHLHTVSERAELRWVDDFLKSYPGAELFLVGGAVRDLLLNRPTKDFDFVIAGLPATQLEEYFRTLGSLDLVGERFGVYKFQYKEFD